VIADLVRLSALYVLVRAFIQIAFPSGRYIVKYLFWAGVVLTIVGTVGPQISRMTDDLHDVAVTYTKAKEGVQAVTNAADTVTSWPATKDSIPYIGTGASKYPPGLTFTEKIRPSTIRFSFPVQGSITQDFKGADHHGIDIACNEGTAVRSAREGKVVVVNSDNVYGNYVMVDHGSGWVTLYAHLSKISVKGGDKLWGTDNVVGLSGNTGNSTGPHLHFEIRVGGKTINPKEWME